MREKPFADYPDIVNIDQLREMLGGVGYKAAYRLLHDGSIRCFKIGNDDFDFLNIWPVIDPNFQVKSPPYGYYMGIFVFFNIVKHELHF